MGKSLGNFITLDQFFTGEHELLSQAYSPMVIRFFILGAHYRSTVDFSNEALQASEKGLQRLLDAAQLLEGLKASDNSSTDISAFRENCYKALNDDLNSPIVIAELFEMSRIINSVHSGLITLNEADLNELKSVFKLFFFDLLGLFDERQSDNKSAQAFSGAVDLLLEIRSTAKQNKDWATSDHIRNQLTALGFTIKDTKDGAEWKLG